MANQDPNCTCDLEAAFSAVPCYSNEPPYGRLVEWEVIDAECESVAKCSEERYARLVAWALDEMARRDQREDRIPGEGLCVVHFKAS